MGVMMTDKMYHFVKSLLVTVSVRIGSPPMHHQGKQSTALFLLLLVCSLYLLFTVIQLSSTPAEPTQIESIHVNVVTSSVHIAITPLSKQPVSVLDAVSPDQLINLVHSLHKDPRVSHEHDRPIYAPTEVVNAAYKAYTGRTDTVVCKDTLREAIFATPINCMRTLVPNHLPKSIGMQRMTKIAKRSLDSCLFTRVLCVDPYALDQSPQELIGRINSQFYNKRRKFFWFADKVFGCPETVNAAFKLLYPSQKASGDVCRKQKDQVDSETGSLLAEFPDKEQCFKRTHNNCHTVYVECIE
jgi:hypothetical protein